MNTTSKDIEANVENILSCNGVSYSITLAAKGIKRNNWDCDQWVVNINGQAFDYFTGLGHRKKIRTYSNIKHEYIYVEGGPIAPHIASVIYSLLLDASANNELFNNWCDNFGYSSDSISAFEIYRECCATAKKLNAVIKPSLQAQLSEALTEY